MYMIVGVQCLSAAESKEHYSDFYINGVIGDGEFTLQTYTHVYSTPPPHTQDVSQPSITPQCWKDMEEKVCLFLNSTTFLFVSHPLSLFSFQFLLPFLTSLQSSWNMLSSWNWATCLSEMTLKRQASEHMYTIS